MSGLIPQSIISCLEVLDDILTQRPNIVSSAIFAEKKSNTSSDGNIIDHIANIIGCSFLSIKYRLLHRKISGIKDIKTINANANLSELGMDSMTATLIGQRLEREFDVVLSFKELRRQTITG